MGSSRCGDQAAERKTYASWFCYRQRLEFICTAGPPKLVWNLLPNLLFYSPPPPTGQQPAEKQGLLITEASRPHSVTHNTLVRTPLDELSARRRDLYLTTHNTHKRQTPTPPTGFEPAIPAGERPQIHALGLICSVVTWGKAARA